MLGAIASAGMGLQLRTTLGWSKARHAGGLAGTRTAALRAP